MHVGDIGTVVVDQHHYTGFDPENHPERDIVIVEGEAADGLQQAVADAFRGAGLVRRGASSWERSRGPFLEVYEIPLQPVGTALDFRGRTIRVPQGSGVVFLQFVTG
jgi:hypothetical protein